MAIGIMVLNNRSRVSGVSICDGLESFQKPFVLGSVIKQVLHIRAQIWFSFGRSDRTKPEE